MKKEVLSGNEAVALGAYEAGAGAGTGYPGTPSTEVLENFSKYPDVRTEWSVNEKVAYEVALGSALTGCRTIVTMKHVGLNVAADPFFTSSYTGIKGGMVIVCADDPGMHSSQNEQDSRNYAMAAKIPLLEPSDSQEAKDYTTLAFDISEQFDTPVMIRLTTRVSHSKTVVITNNKILKQRQDSFSANKKKYVMIPAYARERHRIVEERMKALSTFANTLNINNTEINNTETGFITSGITYNYLKEHLPDASVLKLGMVHPLPIKMILDFSKKVKHLIIAEELDPFIEREVNANNIQADGKKYFPITGEFSPDLFTQFQKNINTKEPFHLPKDIAPPRPPRLCPGCSHSQVFTVLKKLGVIVTGDIGCYTLGVLPPYNAIDTVIDMGASITMSQGIELGEGKNYKNNSVAVIGDGTFAHSGITGLLNAAYNKRTTLIIILDNGTTAMTGMQPNPLSGTTINGEETTILNYKKLAEAVGIKDENYKLIETDNPTIIEENITTLMKSKKLSLIVVKTLCQIIKIKNKKSSRQASCLVRQSVENDSEVFV